MTIRQLARLIWAVNAVAFVALGVLAARAFGGQPIPADPDRPVLTAGSQLDIPAALLLVGLPLLALAGSVLLTPNRRTR